MAVLALTALNKEPNIKVNAMNRAEINNTLFSSDQFSGFNILINQTADPRTRV